MWLKPGLETDLQLQHPKIKSKCLKQIVCYYTKKIEKSEQIVPKLME